MHTYTLSYNKKEDSIAKKAVEKYSDYFSKSMVIDNIKWYCHFRWMVVVFLFLYGMLSFSPELCFYLSLKPFQEWPFFVASILVLGNLLFINHGLSNTRSKTFGELHLNIWVQMVFDLILLTTVVHFVGSLETFVAFTYLFHIVLACIYLPKLHSLYVTLIAVTFYVVCILGENFNIIPPAGIFLTSSLREHIDSTPWIIVYHIISFIGISLVVWYFGSHLSGMIRKKDHELMLTNHELKETQLEKAKHLLRITHELKAPFAAIDANIQLLVKGHCETYSGETHEVLERISARSRKLGHEIQEMLQLANLRSVNNTHLQKETLDLAEMIEWCIAQVKPNAEKKGITIEKNIQSARVHASKDYMKMLFVNLLSNAITYSNENGNVKINCVSSENKGPIVTIEDNGIGIEGEKLPKIFDEYYRTDEAARHNKNSTGLGLTIVKHVAQSHNIAVKVFTTLGSGTKFELRFPKQSALYCTPKTGQRNKV